MNRGTSRGEEFAFGVEQPPGFYDRNFETREHWREHYTGSPYYSLWTAIADRIRSSGVKKILDVGCEPGQVAGLLRDIGMPEYKGLDFSTARIARARIVCPEFQFVAANVFEDGLLETYPYECALMMEFLEHVEQDIEVLGRVRPGTTVLATLPNFTARGHVRHFDSVNALEERYRPLFRKLEVAAVLANERGKTFYIVQGTRCCH